MGRKGLRNSRYKTKNHKRDIDQIWEDVKEENIVERISEATKFDEDRPGLGQYFCVHCDKYFINQKILDEHCKQKPHKRRLKFLETTPHTQEDADKAAGISKEDYDAPFKKKRRTDTDLSATHSVTHTPIPYVYAE